jgi:hypothetical protein
MRRACEGTLNVNFPGATERWVQHVFRVVRNGSIENRKRERGRLSITSLRCWSYRLEVGNVWESKNR